LWNEEWGDFSNASFFHGESGFLNRWNDTLATPLEHHPMGTAKQHLAGHGWSPGKHAR